jgi:hypothetical protein
MELSETLATRAWPARQASMNLELVESLRHLWLPALGPAAVCALRLLDELLVPHNSIKQGS